MDWWVGPLVTLLVAVITGSGVWAGVLLTRRWQMIQRQDAERAAAEKQQRETQQQKLRAVSYASRLRAHIERGDPPPPEDWPEGIYD
ncbi:hypothetical protein [Microbacterium sp. NPDC089696]|uniref:hypothetical protein n=1 Tax=Microbacterium sp. NPDC089696 TaxID=3364199 RepID=UPI003804E87D